MQYIWISLCCTIFAKFSSAFSIIQQERNFKDPSFSNKVRKSSSTRLNLIPLSEFNDQVSFLSKSYYYRLCIGKKGQLRPSLLPKNENEGYFTDSRTNIEAPYFLCIAEEDDLPAISRLTVDAFGAGTVTLSGDLNDLERALIGPTVGLWNEYTDIMAYTEVLSGVRTRMQNRFQTSSTINQDFYDLIMAPPDVSNLSTKDAAALAEKTSIILAVARPNPNSDSVSDIDCVATVELRLQPTDGKIPFTQPWLDRIERKLAKFLNLTPVSPQNQLLQPYLSNLCVAESVRGRRIGKALVRCVENIAIESWGYRKLYLHVDLENIPALNLYEREGFQDVGFRWNPFWSGRAADIGYFVKTFD